MCLPFVHFMLFVVLMTDPMQGQCLSAALVYITKSSFLPSCSHDDLVKEMKDTLFSFSTQGS